MRSLLSWKILSSRDIELGRCWTRSLKKHLVIHKSLGLYTCKSSKIQLLAQDSKGGAGAGVQVRTDGRDCANCELVSLHRSHTRVLRLVRDCLADSIGVSSREGICGLTLAFMEGLGIRSARCNTLPHEA